MVCTFGFLFVNLYPYFSIRFNGSKQDTKAVIYCITYAIRAHCNTKLNLLCIIYNSGHNIFAKGSFFVIWSNSITDQTVATVLRCQGWRSSNNVECTLAALSIMYTLCNNLYHDLEMSEKSWLSDVLTLAKISSLWDFGTNQVT